ncbi:MAG: FAD-binding oxidoreductase [Oscillospiraceae bacterium]|nr:FAD-binding oxidoreductase [Oscillospiraceae bacterium]
MSLSKEAYSALAAIVGERYISDKEFILSGNRVKTPEIPFQYHSADAIVLPADTEQVQKIVKVCNEYGICFVPMVSGVSADAFANRAGSIIIQLSRMNRIIEINEEDRYAIIEPGVRHVQLYPEVRKKGLTYTAAAVGPGGSVLANFTSTSGDHHNQHSASRANRYLLGVEMVLPDGEIIRTGSLQTGSGWFCPDGPGPGLRGIVKGYFGNHGHFGIVTRIAVALDPCHGPAQYHAEGVSPSYKVRMDSPCSKVFCFKYTDIDNLRDAMVKLGEAEVGSTVMKYFYLPATLMMTNSANEFWEKWNSGYKEELKMPLLVHLATKSEAEMEYEETILNDIIRETNGERVRRDIESWWEDHMDFFMIVSRLQSVLRLGGGWMPTKLGADSVHHIFEVGKNISNFIHEFTDTGILFDAPEDYQIVPMEYGHFAHIELLIMWDRTNPAVGPGLGRFRQRSREVDLEKHYHAETPSSMSPASLQLGPLYSNCHEWILKLKESFDPNNVANPTI